MEQALHTKAIHRDKPVVHRILKAIVYILLLAMAFFTLIPFAWMLFSSFKLEREVFSYPMTWLPETWHWENYSLIWQKVSLLTYFKNTAFIALVVTFLQTLTSSFAAYAFAKLEFRGRDALFLAYIGTIAIPWQAYMLPQFIMMRSIGLYDTLWAMVRRLPDASVLPRNPHRPVRSRPAGRAERVRHLAADHAAPVQGRHRHPGHLHLRQYLERLHGTHDLPDPG